MLVGEHEAEGEHEEEAEASVSERSIESDVIRTLQSLFC